MSKQLTLLVGGKERTFDFGRMWFLKFYGQATGEDPLNTTDIELKPEKQFDFVVNTLYAGLQTQYKVEKKTFDFTKEDVMDWIGIEDASFVSSFIEKFVALSMNTAEGNASAPQNPSGA